MATFKDAATEDLFNGVASRKSRHLLPKALVAAARRKLAIVVGAAALNDLRVPPGNRLEALKGEREGQYSVRINDQYRICFVWTADGAENVEVVDYH